MHPLCASFRRRAAVLTALSLLTACRLDDDGPGSLREALGLGGPAVITFDVEGALDLAAPVAVPSEVTLSGRGRDLVIRSNGLWLDGVHDVRIEDLSFQDIRGPGDAIAITNGAARIIVLHSTFSLTGSAPAAASRSGSPR